MEGEQVYPFLYMATIFWDRLQENEKNKYYNKKYAHFDIRKNYNDYKEYIKNPDRIKSHGFYPFIRYEIKFVKYNKKDNEVKSKARKISYSAHIDRYI